MVWDQIWWRGSRQLRSMQFNPDLFLYLLLFPILHGHRFLLFLVFILQVSLDERWVEKRNWYCCRDGNDSWSLDSFWRNLMKRMIKSPFAQIYVRPIGFALQPSDPLRWKQNVWLKSQTLIYSPDCCIGQWKSKVLNGNSFRYQLWKFILNSLPILQLQYTLAKPNRDINDIHWSLIEKNFTHLNKHWSHTIWISEEIYCTYYTHSRLTNSPSCACRWEQIPRLCWGPSSWWGCCCDCAAAWLSQKGSRRRPGSAWARGCASGRYSWSF